VPELAKLRLHRSQALRSAAPLHVEWRLRKSIRYHHFLQIGVDGALAAMAKAVGFISGYLYLRLASHP